MKEILREIWNLINSTIGVVVVTAVVTTSLNVFYQKFKVKIEQRTRYENVLGDQIAKAFIAVRDIELKATSIELHNVVPQLKEKDFDIFHPDTARHSIMNSGEDFNAFFCEINAAREKYEPYLDYDSAAYLYYMERYSIMLMKYISEHQPLDYPTAGVIFYADIQKWQSLYDALLIKRMNQQKCRLYVKSGWRWERAKKKVTKELWERSILFKKINESTNQAA